MRIALHAQLTMCFQHAESKYHIPCLEIPSTQLQDGQLNSLPSQSPVTSPGTNTLSRK